VNERAYLSQYYASWMISCGARFPRCSRSCQAQYVAAPDFRAVAEDTRHSTWKGHDVTGSLCITADERVAMSGLRFSTVTNASTL